MSALLESALTAEQRAQADANDLPSIFIAARRSVQERRQSTRLALAHANLVCDAYNAFQSGSGELRTPMFKSPDHFGPKRSSVPVAEAFFAQVDKLAEAQIVALIGAVSRGEDAQWMARALIEGAARAHADMHAEFVLQHEEE